MFFKVTILTILLFALPACSSGSNETGAKSTSTVERETEQPILSFVPRMMAVHSPFCSVCKKMKPIVNSLIAQCDHKGVRVETVDVSREENEHLIDEYRIEGLPTYLFIDEVGYEVARLVGEQTELTLKQALAVLRGEECPGLGRLNRNKKI